MSVEMWITLGVLVVAIVLFVTEKLRVDVVALGVVVALMMTGILSVDEAIAGFSSSAVLLIAALFIVGGGVFQTGLALSLAQQIIRIAGTSETRLVVLVMITVAVMSGFVSDTGTVAVVMPAVISLAASVRMPASKLLLPLAFASLLGGASTLIGTPPNIIVSETLQEAGLEPFGFFSYSIMGVVLTIVGIAYMVFMQRFLPERTSTDYEESITTPAELLDVYQVSEQIYHLRVQSRSSLIGQMIKDTDIGKVYHIDILEISRPAPARTLASVGSSELVMQSKRNIPIHPHPDTVLAYNDVLIVRASSEDIATATAKLKLSIQPSVTDKHSTLISEEVGIAEIVIPPRSSLINKSIEDVKFGTTYHLTVLGIKRPSAKIGSQIKDAPLQFGDSLLIQGEWKDIFELRKKPRDFVIIGGTQEIRSHLLNFKKAPIVLVILAGMLVFMITGWLPTTTVAMLAALLVVLTGCLTMDEAYEAIDWKSIVLIAGMLPMSTAMVKVGLVELAATIFTNTLGDFGPIIMMGGLFLITSVFTQVLSNTATTVIIAPLALVTAQALGIDPRAFLMAVAIAASMAFATPVASPVNTLVMGAGQYRFADYMKIGIPLIGLAFITVMILLPIIFPFYP
ncbi:MAG: SLC13 family permease [Chloroflexota bacterium]